MTKSLRSLARDERGASLIEMGIALPILAMMLGGTIDLSRAYADKLRLEQAAQSTVETVQQVGYNHSTTSTPTSLGALENEAKARAGAGSTATATAFIECRNGTTKTTISYTSNCPTGQTQARYVKIVMTRTYTPMFGFKFLGANAQGQYTIDAESALRIQ